MNLFKLKTQYIFVTVALILVMIAVSATTYIVLSQYQAEQLKQGLIDQNRQTFHNEISKRGDQIASYLGKALFDPLYDANLEEVKSLLKPIITLGEVEKVLVFDSEGIIFHDGTAELALFGSEFHDQDLAHDVLNNLSRFEVFTPDILVITTPIVSYRETIGGLHIELSLVKMQAEIEEVRTIVSQLNDESLNALFWSVGISTIILLFIGGTIAIAVSSSLTRPLQSLTQHAEELGAGNFNAIDTLKQINRADEVGDLALALTAMAEKIEQRTSEISHLAYHDALTSLPNRVKFIANVNEQVSIGPHHPFAIIFIDLDEFKLVNDNYGHALGDELLCNIAKRLTSFCSNYSTNSLHHACVSRIGGDEFLMLMPLTDAGVTIEDIAANIFTAVRAPLNIHQEELVIGGSLGIAIHPDGGTNADELIKNADIAMYCAKSSGKNTYKLFNHRMNDAVVKRARTERELRSALPHLEQFELWFQPLIDLSTDQMIGAEALVRWRHPEHGVILPNEFIDVAEETGLILPIGEWLITHLCQQLALWQPYIHREFHVALNLSCRQLYHQSLSSFFLGELSRFNIETSQVHLEITESMLFKDEGEAEKTLMALHTAGVMVWLDDFGTGYSSLSYLRRFQVNGFKIDRSFVENLVGDEKDQKLVQAMISMAKNLDLTVVAEGITRQEQITLLKRYGCDYGQGFFYSEALSASEFTCWLQEHNDSFLPHQG